MGPDGVLSLACAHRPMTGVDHEGMQTAVLPDLPASIWVSYVPLADVMQDVTALTKQSQHHILLKPEFAWERVKIGGGAPPILTACGWLLIHHGIEQVPGEDGIMRLRYAAGAFIVDRWDIRRVVWRSAEPIMVPNSDSELFGVVDNVVFPSGIDQDADGAFDIYYGMADARIGVARMWLAAEASRDGVIEAA